MMCHIHVISTSHSISIRLKVTSANAYVKSTQKLLAYPKNFLTGCAGWRIYGFINWFFIWVNLFHIFHSNVRRKSRKKWFLKSKWNPRTYSFLIRLLILTLMSYAKSAGNWWAFSRGFDFARFQALPCFITISNWKETFVENNQLVNKIEVIPNEKNDPVSQEIFISWKIPGGFYSADLFVTRNQQIEFVDTLQNSSELYFCWRRYLDAV